ncbi:protein RICE SALT SENSITIVE 3-like isoform X2 [Durio zibethinus]|uniref:Protein RICE SALT SENSITIVE 3-like isoform X2 n=1 Tax=Durio zibethinus TaxID=66656 RepID=A0A6P5WMP3_DURZI|nr:protein RICE SALT SENSITIVE 3-like isoform X2 [Durio zibethinus]
MVGSGSADRSKEAVGMMALHEALRAVCLNSDWTYSVFWTIRPRPRVRGGNGCKVGDDNGSLMLMWEDGFCRGRVTDCLEEIDVEDPVRKAFSKMSIQLYNYGEGLMGKVASDKCHKWVFKEPTECEPNISNYWQSSFDATIAVIQAGHGLLQLGSCKIITEDLHFVLRMRHTFESLGYQSGFYLSQLFSSNRNGSSSSTIPSRQSAVPIRPPPPLFNWSQRPLPPVTPMLASPNFQNPARLGFPQAKDETHMFLMPHSSETRMEDMMGEHENDIKWPNGLSFFNALTGRTEDVKLLFNPESLGNKADQNHHPLVLEGKDSNQHSDAGANPNEFLSLDSHPENSMKMENKFKRSFTLPARMATSSSSTSVDHHQHRPVEYRNSEAGIYTDDGMETFLE